MIRQQVETTRFQAGSRSVRRQRQFAVVETVAGDAMDTVLERLETTLQEAKRCGRNRTFFHDGKFPTPVVPPILSLSCGLRRFEYPSSTGPWRQFLA